MRCKSSFGIREQGQVDRSQSDLSSCSLAAATLFTICQSTCASPVETSQSLSSTNQSPASSPRTLFRRASEQVIQETTDSDPGHRGTMHCFDSGSFVTANYLQDAWVLPCERNFNFEPNAAGQHDPQNSDITIACIGIAMLPPTGVGPNRCDGKTDFHVLFDAKFAPNTKHAKKEECEWVYNHIAQVCHGADTYSRGGWFQFEDDGTTYGMDPTDPDAGGE
ncbi:MAG: hypothetical protein L6R37_007671 [Teloschistes peruensis]|nr:MAG: hypothetical protein L6R37_007671 [Teloschistes peruensis]